MLANDQMKPNRYLDMMSAKRLYQGIVSEIGKGLAVQVTTYTQSRIYRTVEQFKLGKYTVYAQRGKHWDDIRGASVRSIRA